MLGKRVKKHRGLVPAIYTGDKNMCVRSIWEIILAAADLSKDQSSLVAFLGGAGVLGEDRPRQIETLGAIIFLTEKRAYKLKRAVSYSFMDFSDLNKRNIAAKSELQLNRRTATNLYLGLTPVYRFGQSFRLGELCEELDPDQSVAAHLVTMERFEDGQTLDQLAEAGKLDGALIDQLADTIAGFHAKTPSVHRENAASSLTQAAQRTLRDILAAKDLLGDCVDLLNEKMKRTLTKTAPSINHRGMAGYIKRLHGDLHLGNVVRINEEAVIFDALEFNSDMATIDELHDLAFLVMDLWVRGASELATRTWSRYLAARGIYEGQELAPLFIAMRAAVRTKVSLHAASLREGDDNEIKLAEARRYLDMALNALTEPKPRLVAIGGLSGSGKTRLAQSLAPFLAPPVGGVHLRSDAIRKRRAGQPFDAKLPATAYTAAENFAVYETLMNEAEEVLHQGRPVIVDAVFARESEREAAETIAKRLNVPFDGFWLDVDLYERQKRIERRKNDISDATPEVAARQENFELGQIHWKRLNSIKSPLDRVTHALLL
jgi:aminoglycoside phosphotransferase family enzyme/predicted kinase